MSKILFVANTDWYLYNFRLSLAEFLRDQNDEVVMVSPAGKFVEQIEAAGFRWIEWPIDRRTIDPLGEIKALWALRKIYSRERPDLVHHFTIKPVLYGSLATLGMHIFVVNSITGLGYLFLQDQLNIKMLRALSMELYRLALHRRGVAIIFENRNDQEFFQTHHLMKPGISYVIEGVGVDEDRFYPTPEEPGIPLIVLPARMLWDKGVEVMVKAARLLHLRVEVRVALVGETDPGNPANIPEETIQNWVKEGIVEWWGFREDMQSVFQKANIVTLPSFREGLPTVLIEAAACGRPIVATNVAGCREVVEDGITGFLVPATDPNALADALEKLVVQPDLRARMGTAGRQKVLNQFTKSKINADTLEIYQQILLK